MFKKTKIAAVSAAILGLSSMTAQAVSLNETGSDGEVLIFPYYNVNNGYITSYNISNTTDNFKAIKIRFRESNNSNDVLDFNVYMSPRDVWTMSLLGSGENVRLITTDNTCTQPKIPAAGVLFRDVYDSVDAADLREGYLEVIEMGELDELSEVDVEAVDGSGLETITIARGLKHVDGVPYNCGVVEAAWQQSVFVQGGAKSNTSIPSDTVDAQEDGFPNDGLGTQGNVAGYYGTDSALWTTQEGALTGPQGGIIGSSILIDSVNIAGFVAEPISVVNYSTLPQHYLSSDQHFYLLPSLASGDIAEARYLDDNHSTAITTTWAPVVRDWGLDDKNLLPNESVPSGINPLPIADAMAVTFIGNQYFLSGGIATDWVVGTPMRKHAIFNDFMYDSTTCATTVACQTVGYTPGVDIPVAGELGDLTAPNGFWNFLDGGDVEAKFGIGIDEEAQATIAPGDFSPPLQTPAVLVPFEREVNILALSNGTTPASVLGSDNAQGLILATGFDDGWGAFDFQKYSLTDATRYGMWTTLPTGTTATGVPLSGFMAARGPLSGQNVGETFPHAVKRIRGVAP